ncbi:MAG: glycosyltransferase family 4 protein [Solirubrobacterales bacterium]|nr:glycosyltransferase family 4 protein [Solirubrobacterales bacterium]
MTHAREVIAGLRKIGCEVEVREAIINPDPSGSRPRGQFEVPLACRLLPGFASMGGDLALLLKASRAIKSADLVYQRQTPCSVAALLLATLCGKPFVLEYNSTIDHDGSQALLGWYERLTERLNLRYASRIVVISEVLKQELIERGLSKDRLVLNPNGVDPDRFRGDDGPVRRSLGFEDEDVVYGFVGTFGFWHGAPVLARSFASFAPEHPQAKLLLVGDGEELPETLAILTEAGLGDRFVHTGRVEADRIPGLLGACDVLCSPHVPWPDGRPFHGSPTKLFEYMAAGRAILASELGQIGEVLDDEETAILVPPGDGDALAAAMGRVYGDPALRSSLGEAARSRTEEFHTWEKNAERIVAPT